MKTKTFSGESEAVIIKAVNDWLAGETGITIRDTKTAQALHPTSGTTVTTFMVWYDQDNT